MQISTNQFYATSSTLMSQLSAQADTLQTQISTGKKLQDPSDDPVAYQQLQLLTRQTADDTTYQANISTAQSLLSQSDSTLSSVVSQIQRAQELAVQANSDTVSDDQRQAIATELRSIVGTLAGLANATNAQGKPLFGGSQGTAPVTQNADGSVTINATGSATSIPVGQSQTVVAGDSASDVFGGIDNGSGTSDLFSILNSFADAMEAGGDSPTSAAADAGDALANALTHVSDVQASVGAREKRLTLMSSTMTDTAATRETQRSSLEDTDITQAVTDLQKTMTILQATQASFTKLSSLSLFDYLK